MPAFPGSAPFEENPIAAFRATMETNYFGALRCIQAVSRHARTTVRLFCQRHIGVWQAFRGAAGSLFIFKIRARGGKRIPGAGSESFRSSRGDRRTGRHRDTDLRQGATALS